MSHYFIGDIHGCYDEFLSLLKQIAFDPKKDTLWLTGDLVAKGPYSLDVLRHVRDLGSSAHLVLGNHDLHLLAICAGICDARTSDRLSEVLQASDLDELMHWLRQQPFLLIDEQNKVLMTHAGVLPQWDLETTKRCALALENHLRSDNYVHFLREMLGNTPDKWADVSNEVERQRFCVNVFTRMRYCYSDGRLDLSCKSAPTRAPDELYPWFSFPLTIPKNYTLFFGHWATLEGKKTPPGIIALDTGCYHGGSLTLFRAEDKTFFSQSAYCKYA